jgi:hypothetical protein
MKNIHLIPTDKPTGIFESKNGLHFSIIEKIRYGEFKGFHIYITSDEEIKGGDWFVQVNTKKIIKHHPKNGLLIQPQSFDKKIILTTDPDLIKDDVQAIDDEFLEWFVKNPSCDTINIDSIPNSNWGFDLEEPMNLGYKIIIPQEEPNPCKDIVINDKATIDVLFHNKHIRFENLTSEQAGYLLQVSEFYQLSGTRISAVVPQEKQIKCYCGHTITCDCEPLQETIEEAATKLLYEKYPYHPPQDSEYWKDMFLEGTNWQKERMYSEEEVEVIAKDAYAMGRNNILIGVFNKWFEQFKKK